MRDVEDCVDLEKLLGEKIILDKIEAARRQLESAIRMFFFEWDVVSQHTLISAAHGIVYDLAKIRGIGGSVKGSTLIPPDRRNDFIKAVNFPQNFFKHADRDSGRKMVFRYNASQFYLFDAVRLFVLLYGTATYPMKVFLMWFQLQYPGLLRLDSADEDLKKIREVISDPAGLKAYAKIFLEKEFSSEQRQATKKLPTDRSIYNG